MHHLYRMLCEEVNTLSAIRRDIVVHHEEGEKGAVGFRVDLSSGDTRCSRGEGGGPDEPGGI